MAKDLFHKDIASLQKRSEISIPKSTSYAKCLSLLESVNKNALDMKKKKDEEMEFYYLHRYLNICTYLSESEKNNNISLDRHDIVKKKAIKTQAKENILRYEELRESLMKRYKAAEMAKKPPDVPSDEPKKPDISRRPAIFTPSTGIAAVIEKGFVECCILYSLIKSKELKELVLIFDVRPANDFKSSQLCYKHLLNIPAEVLTVGMSADALGKKFADPDKLWDKRGVADLLVLMDWSSSSSSRNPQSSTVFILKNILTAWDPRTNYKSKPVILEGGYEEFIERYPQLTTDPKVEIPRPVSSSSNDALSSLDYPMEELEPKSPPPPKVLDVPQPTPSLGDKGDVLPAPPPAPKSAPAAVDRSTKPRMPSRIDPDNINQIMDELATSLSEDDEPSSDPFVPNRPQQNGDVSSVIKPIGTSDTTPMEDSSDEEVPNGQTDSEHSRKPDPALVENLRKLKPSNINNKDNRPDESWNSRGDERNGIKDNLPDESWSPRGDERNGTWSSASNNTNDVSFEALKKDGSTNGILRRSSSSPNISKMGDDESLTVPSFSRANKPVVPKRQYVFNERLDSTFGKTAAPGLTGLKNFANNCYMNSIVQCLNNTEPLVLELISAQTSLNQNQWRGRRQGRIAQEMIEAFRNMWSGEIRVYSIRELKILMGEIKDIFKGSMHQDSNEFLIILLEHLHEDLNVPAEVGTLAGAVEETGEKAWGEFRRKNCSIIQQLFYGQHKSTVTCESCGHASATFEQFFNLFVPIPSNQNTVTLNDCLQLYMSGERISGWKCPECKTERNATKKIDISRLPPVLVIALKRFTQEDDSWLHKKENLVTYPLDNLEMSRFTVPGSEQRHRTYSLYAMSTHSGTLQSGHYRAVCKNFYTKRWFMFDDSTVEALSELSVQNNPEVYILFYISTQS